MRFFRSRSIRSFAALVAVALLSCSLAACGGGSGSVPGQQHASNGTVFVDNATGFSWATVTITATNGSVSASNISDGQRATFSNVGPGSFSVTAFDGAGHVLAGGSSSLAAGGTTTLTLN